MFYFSFTLFFTLSAQSNQSLRFLPEELIDSLLPIECPSKILISLRECAGWSESWMGTHASLCPLLYTGPCLSLLLSTSWHFLWVNAGVFWTARTLSSVKAGCLCWRYFVHSGRELATHWMLVFLDLKVKRTCVYGHCRPSVNQHLNGGRL